MIRKYMPVILSLTFLAGIVVVLIMSLLQYQSNLSFKADDSDSTEQGVRDVVNANNEFAFDLYSRLSHSEEGNLFYSPYSISAALAMVYEGAGGKTAEEMKSTLHFPENTVLRPNFASIYNDVNEKAKDYELRTGNALWVQKNFPLDENYANRIEKYYGGKASNLDFVTETEKSRQTINSFIEKQTNDKIKDLIPSGMVDEAVRLVLTNAIYFKGVWQWEFNVSSTRDKDFKLSEDNVIKVPTMNMSPEKAMFNYANTGDAQILELPYKGDKISMVILLPTEDLASIEPTLTAEKFNEYKSAMRETKLDSISLPKFEFNSKYFMNDTLIALGITTAFSGDADFSGMTDQEDLYISFVIHQAFVKVDEKGTEAAAATAVVMRLSTAIPRNVFKADRPFIFAIQERATGNILFLGRVTDPTK